MKRNIFFLKSALKFQTTSFLTVGAKNGQRDYDVTSYREWRGDRAGEATLSLLSARPLCCVLVLKVFTHLKFNFAVQ